MLLGSCFDSVYSFFFVEVLLLFVVLMCLFGAFYITLLLFSFLCS